MNATAQRARNLALAQHREELDALSARVKHYREWMQAWRIAAIIWVVTLLAATVFFGSRMKWNNPADAPPLQRVKVITEGFKDKAGHWRSFDNGEPITVTEWKP